jgi:hypothetical protein
VEKYLVFNKEFTEVVTVANMKLWALPIILNQYDLVKVLKQKGAINKVARDNKGKQFRGFIGIEFKNI